MKEFKPLFEDCTLSPLYIAGPCSAESREQLLSAAEGVARVGVQIFRAGVWKPRTKPGSFEGVGAEALEWLKEAKERYSLRIVTEVATPEHLEQALNAGVDGVWIGARTTTNPFATQQIADALRGVDTAVLIKNPVIPDVDLWIGAIERIYNSGIRRIAAVHRGFGTHHATLYRNDPHWSLISDPSHIGGRRDLVAPLSQQALDLGFSGLMVECHPTPDMALSDASQQITPEAFKSIIDGLKWRRTPADNGMLSQYRMHIDTIDSRIVELLAERMEVAREIGEHKRQHGMAIVQRDRFNEVLKSAEARAEFMGLSRSFIHTIITAIHEESVRQQSEINGEN